MTMTEEKFYLHLLDFISNGKCGRRTAAPTECPWIRLASVCVESTGWSIPVIRATCAEPVACPGMFFGGVQQIQLRTEDREDGDLGVVAP